MSISGMDNKNVSQLSREATGKTIWKHKHVLDLDDFSTEEIELVFNTADAMSEILSREIKKVPTLRGTTIVNMFYEPSTRTRSLLELAAKNLSADVIQSGCFIKVA